MLTPKQDRFIELYCNPKSETFGNATKSYVKAGYADNKGTGRSAARLINTAQISTAIKAYVAENKAKTEVTRDWCIDKLKQITEKEGANDGDIIRAVDGIAKLNGFHREDAPNLERLAEVRQFTEEQRELLRKTLQAITDQQAKAVDITARCSVPSYNHTAIIDADYVSIDNQ